MIGVQEQLWLHLALAERPVEVFVHQRGSHPLIELPADDTASEPIDPDNQLPPAGYRAGVGDPARPAAPCGSCP